MRLVTFIPEASQESKGGPRVGALVDDGRSVLDFDRAIEADERGSAPWFDMEGRYFAKARALCDRIGSNGLDQITTPGALYSLSEVTLLAPIARPGKLICIGLNYRDHAVEAKMPIPERPVVFSKFTTAVTGPGASVVAPPSSSQVDYEAELAVVIGRRGKQVGRAQAFEYVLGYTNFNDVTARDFQFADGQWQRGKSCDTFAPMGPFIATVDEVPNPHVLPIKLRLNGQTMQDSNTDQFIFGVPELIEFLSETITLEPGDVIATGTPPGVGFARKPPVFLKAGDVMEVEIEGLGVLKNPVA